MEVSEHGRHPEGMRVMLYWNGIPMLPGRLREVSDRGLFVQISPRELVAGGSLEVGVWCNRTMQCQRRFQARLVRKARDGVLLAIEPGEGVSTEDLRHMLSKVHANSDPRLALA